ncbi:hypothetical protein LguiB_004331 [Lonicera macranthoides]
MAEQIACTVVEKVIEKVVNSISRQFSYILCYNSNITNLTDGVQDLLHKSAGVQLSVDRANKNLEVIAPNVEVWLTKVGEIEKKMSEVVEGTEKVKKGCLNGWCPNLKQRYLLSRKAVKQTLEIVKLQEEGAGYTQLSYTAAPTSMAASTSTFRYEVFESRISKTKEVIEALKNSKIHRIGICGVGGVGKTKMVKEIRERAIVEHLFDEVAMAVVSQNLDLRKIQDQLASALQLKLDEKGTTYDRGIVLCKRLMQGRILVIFDDVWEDFDFGELGIPVGGEGESKQCKVLLTSRDKHVCETMQTQVNFTIELLSDEEAWDLFKEKVGDRVENSDLRSIAQKLVNECGHLPLAIVAVGTALKDRDKCAWEVALEQLKTSTATSIEGMDRKVYSVLRLSYDYLLKNQIPTRKKGSNEIQRLFLLCCLFPEDYDIPIESLVRNAWGLRLFIDVKNLAVARNRTKSLVYRLTSCYLLLASDQEGHVKMHDVVRDFGLQEASDGEQVFMVKHNAVSNEWLQNDTIEPYTAISFGTKEELQQPIGLVCPRIQLLNLVAKGSVQISRRYFEGMEELRVISLQVQLVDFDFDSEHMLVESPIKAVKFLINVRMLSLESCRIGKNIGLVGSLQKLEILSFYESDIDVLPSEIGKLINLKLLDLRCNELGLILPDVLSCLNKLEELYMGDYFHGEGVEERNQGNCASITELCSMFCLKTLQISVSKPELLLKLKDFPFGELARFIISEAGYKVYYGGYEFRNRVELEELDVVSVLNSNIRGLMKGTEELKLFNMKGLNNLVKQLNEDGFVNLKDLRISSCNDMIKLFDANLPTGSLGRLEQVWLFNLPVMRQLWRGPIQLPSFVNLKSLKIYGCHVMTSLFSASVVGCIVQLESLIISGCKMLEEIVSRDGAAEDDSRMIEFSNLDILNLRGLPNLKSFISVSDICSSENNQDKLSLFNEVLLPSMRELELAGTNVVSIVGAQMRPGSLYKLRYLTLLECSKIVCVVALEAIKQLKNLENLEVRFCNSVETLFDLEGLEEEVRVFSQLVSIYLRRLDELRHLWKNVPRRGFQGFQNLTELHVENCNKLSYLLSPCIAKLLVNLQKMILWICNMMERVIQREEEEEEDDHFHWSKIEEKNIIVFPQLRSLCLSYLSNLKAFCNRNHCIEFPSLDELDILRCPRMKIFLSRSVKAPKLETVKLDYHSIPVHELNYMLKRQNEAGGEGSDGGGSDGQGSEGKDFD